MFFGLHMNILQNWKDSF